MDIKVSAQGLRLEADTGTFVRAHLRAAVVVATRKVRRAVRRSVKKAQRRHKWRPGAALREAAET